MTCSDSRPTSNSAQRGRVMTQVAEVIRTLEDESNSRVTRAVRKNQAESWLESTVSFAKLRMSLRGENRSRVMAIHTSHAENDHEYDSHHEPLGKLRATHDSSDSGSFIKRECASDSSVIRIIRKEDWFLGVIK